MKAGQKLAESGHCVRIVSFTSWELFEKTDKAYQDSVVLPEVKAGLAVECGIAQGWEKYTGSDGKIISMHGYGASAPAPVMMEKFGFTVENVVATAEQLLKTEK